MKQIEANRKNAARSTGPKSEQGKAAVRYNALTHGFRSKELDLLPKEDAEGFQANLDAWFADYAPTNPTETRLVRQAAILSWKLDRAESREAALLSRQVREAVAQAEQTRRDRVNDALARLLPDADNAIQNGYDAESAASLRETVEGTAEGCRELLHHWGTLREVFTWESFWEPEDEMRAIRLLGADARRISDPAVLDVIVVNRAAMLSGDVLTEPFFKLDGPLGITLDQDAARDACQRWRENAVARMGLLTATADQEIARLQGVLEVRERDGDLGAEEIAEAADIAGFDVGGEVERLQKYQAVMQRQFIKTVETISKLRLQAVKLEKEYARLTAEPSLRGGRSGATGRTRPVPQNLAGIVVTNSDPEPGDAGEADFTHENGAIKANLDNEARDDAGRETGVPGEDDAGRETGVPGKDDAGRDVEVPGDRLTATENGAIKANLAPQIRPSSKNEARRARRNREKAARRYFGKG